MIGKMALKKVVVDGYIFDADNFLVAVYLDDGSELSASREHAYGDPENPLDESAMRAKAAMLLEYGGVAAPAKFIDAMLALAEDATLPDLPPVQS